MARNGTGWVEPITCTSCHLMGGTMEDQQAQFSGWARVEVMGHQTHIGFVKTEAYGGTVLFRIDMPEMPEREFVLQEPGYVQQSPTCTQWVRAGATVRRAARPGASVLVGAASIYRITPCTEEVAIAAVDASERAPLQLVSLPSAPLLGEGGEGESGNDNDEEDGKDDESDGSF